MNTPQIATAIPKRRYQLGDFSIVVLGDIESGDGNDYRYVFALVQEGSTSPGMYVLSIKSPDSADDYLLRLVSPSMERDLDCSPAWRDLDHFCEQAIAVAQQVLGMKDEFPHRLM